uniref:GrpE protein homolog n=1 Tax=Ascaris lumbricoides TaxID=6252 RepID=A0A0M3IQC3_ASCLU
MRNYLLWYNFIENSYKLIFMMNKLDVKQSKWYILSDNSVCSSENQKTEEEEINRNRVDRRSEDTNLISFLSANIKVRGMRPFDPLFHRGVIVAMKKPT